MRDYLTLRDIIDIQGEDYLGALLAGLGFLRSAAQREPCTEEGCFASALKWIEFYGEPSLESIELWKKDLGQALDASIPFSFVNMVLAASKEDAEEIQE